jgi:hypothetical protein
MTPLWRLQFFRIFVEGLSASGMLGAGEWE